MTTCQWMQMTYSCGRATSILSWRRATYPGGEPRIKMGESTPALPEPCAHLLYTHAVLQHNSPTQYPDQKLFFPHQKEYALPPSTSQRAALHVATSLSLYSLAHMLSSTCNQCRMCRSYTLHWPSHALATWFSLKEGHFIYLHSRLVMSPRIQGIQICLSPRMGSAGWSITLSPLQAGRLHP